MADIFISYANEDIDRVVPLANALEKQGWSVFWDRKITPGRTWDDIIEEAIEAAKCIIVVWTKASVKSGWVRAEAQEGLDREILVPVKFEDVKIPLRFRPVQAANLIGWEENTSNIGLKNLQDALIDILGSPPDEEEERIRQAEENRKRENAEAKDKAEDERKREEAEARIRAEEERKKKEAKEKRKFEEERKRNELKAELKPEKPELEAREYSEPKSAAPRKSSNALKFGSVAGAIVLLIVGIGLYIIKPTSPLKTLPANEGTPKAEKKVKTQPGHVFRDKLKVGGEGPEMIILEAGNFLMGSEQKESPQTEGMRYEYEGPQHSVTISKPFALSTHEITFVEYDTFAKATKSQLPDDKGWGRGYRPVIKVSWADARAYAVWLSEQTGQHYRLLTEAEWEYAARSGSASMYSFGNDESKLAEYAWYAKNSGGKTHPVGQKKPNAWGLYDMHGNVWEWVEDHWHHNYTGAPNNGQARIHEPNTFVRVIRGGGWNNIEQWCRSRIRNSGPPGTFDYVGFRLARSLTLGP